MHIIVKKRTRNYTGESKTRNFTEMKTELKAMKSRLNNAEKGISDLKE